MKDANFVFARREARGTHQMDDATSGP